jgi:3-oxoacyl-[acyl-carrier protein] reductase
MSLSGKVVVVTGASRGIGAAIAQRLANDGASVVINYASNSSAADKLVETISKDKAIAVQADVSTVAGVEKLVTCTVEKFSKIDAIIPNAGIMYMRTIENTTEEDFDKMFATNVKGPYFLVQKALPHMKPGSRVIFISTGINKATNVGAPYLLYASTKGAIDQMTRVLSKGLAAKGINVNAVAPGPTATDLFLEGKSEQVLNAITSQNPYGRLGKPEEIADVISFLCSEDSKWVDGQTIFVNGGTMV